MKNWPHDMGQSAHSYDQPDIDGVFGLWYGKGPGLNDHDAMRHANMGGVSPHGGLVFAVGDDATGKSSTVATNQNKHWSRPVCHFSIHGRCMISSRWGCRPLPCRECRLLCWIKNRGRYS